MLPKDKYTLFDKKEKTYRKGIHSEWPFVPASSPQAASARPCSWTRTPENGGPTLYLPLYDRFLTISLSQSCPSGRESANVSTLPVSERAVLSHLSKRYHPASSHKSTPNIKFSLGSLLYNTPLRILAILLLGEYPKSRKRIQRLTGVLGNGRITP